MKHYVRVQILDRFASEVWLVSLSEGDLKGLGDPGPFLGGRSSILLTECAEVENGNYLEFPVDATRTIALGDTGDCIAILANPLEDTVAQNENEDDHSVSAVRSSIPWPDERKSGDQAFILSCKEEGLPSEIVALAQEFLVRIRSFSSDDLIEGQGRKWVTKPKNFLAITIQNRKKQFCIHVKKTPQLSTLNATIDVRDDRPGYARFWLQNASQMEEALKAVEASFGQ